MIKRFTIVMVMVFATLWSHGQTNLFSDNFDTYPLGASLAATNPQWTTWSGTTGGNEDVKVSDEQAFSAPHSIKFYDATMQGSVDMVLLLDNKTSGKYEVAFKMFIDTLASAGGYFNMLHALPPTAAWAFSLTFLPTSELSFNWNATPVLLGNYVKGSWMDVKVLINLDIDSAALYINNGMMVEWKWSINESGSAGVVNLAGVNFFSYAGGGPTTSVHYYVDDVSFTQLGNIGTGTSLPVEMVTSFPNPASETIRFNAPGALTLELFTLTGAFAGSIPVENGSASIRSLASGVYIGKMVTPNGVYTTRIVKQ